MDLTSQPTIKTAYEVDPDTNILTVTFKDGADVVIDSIEIEAIKYKALMDALAIIAKERTNPLSVQAGHRTFYRSQLDEGETIFI